MPRSAEAATRFTSTTPHASTPARAHLAQKPIRTPGPPGETNREKVARLRAAAAKARNAQISTMDKVIERGRVWADRAHKFTALSLIAFTGVAGVVTVYALGDMIIYNRRKKAQYFAEQKALHQTSVFEAQKALRNGTLTDEQKMLIADEEKYKKQADAIKGKKGLYTRGREWLFSGLKQEENEVVGGTERITGDSGDRRAVGDVVRDEEARLKESAGKLGNEVRSVFEDNKESVSDAAKGAFERERQLERNGGPLDRIGSAGPPPPPKSGGWTSFMSRG